MAPRAIFSSRSVEWCTPLELFTVLHTRFNFTLDVCATEDNAVVPRYFTRREDGLAQSWAGECCWMNPPYGRAIARWVEKAFRSAQQNGTTVVALLPVRTDTGWWHAFVKKAEIHFIKGRLKFAPAKTSAPFASAVVVFRPPHGSGGARR
jgi:site-specific DNA-methyltransferase (adenine-specific)